MPLILWINGQQRTFDTLKDGITLHSLVELLGFRADRIALELNGEIVSRTQWDKTTLKSNDRLEAVHFVGGGAGGQG